MAKTGDNDITVCKAILCAPEGYIIIIITTLFQDDNLFGIYASLTYGPQLQG